MIFGRITQQGNTLTVKRLSDNLHLPPPNNCRGVITKFSRQSRFRLVRLFASLDQKRAVSFQRKVKFVTLTYKELMKDGALAKLHLKRFMERLQYHYPELWCVWKMELQDRGAIHFHLMLGNIPFVHWFRIQLMWSQCSDQIESGIASWKLKDKEISELSQTELKKTLAFTEIRLVRTFNGVMHYVAKYMSKETEIEDTPELDASQYFSEHPDLVGKNAEIPVENLIGLSMSHNFGRFWGVYGRQHLPVAEVLEFACALPDDYFGWWLSKCNNPHCKPDTSFTLFQANAHELYLAICTLFNSNPALFHLELDAFFIRKAKNALRPVQKLFERFDAIMRWRERNARLNFTDFLDELRVPASLDFSPTLQAKFAARKANEAYNRWLQENTDYTLWFPCGWANEVFCNQL